MELQGPSKKTAVQSKEHTTPFRLLPAYVQGPASGDHQEASPKQGQAQSDLRAQIESFLL